MQSSAPSRRFGRGLVMVSLLLIGGLLAFTQFNTVYDWWRLHGYEPSPAAAQLAADDQFTDEADHLYYINRPEITAKSDFAQNCSSEEEQTIVLGCYHGIQRGIYVLKITDDERLDGVMQVTAAHEMLHAAYDRLSSRERKQVDAWLMDYYQNDLTDQRVKDTVDSYKTLEPNDVVNEMHSIFGTEVASLPPQLESYYAKYFENRKTVTGFASAYQAEFTNRQQLVSQYDAQLKQLKSTIESNEAELSQRASSLKAQSAEMDQLRRGGRIAEYNARVSTYNQGVSSYSALANNTRSLISQYNQQVELRNKIALEQQQLAQELSGNDVSTIPKQ